MDGGVQIEIVSDQNIVNSIFWRKSMFMGGKDFGLLMGNVIEQGETSFIYVEDIFPVGKLDKASDILSDARWLDIRAKALKKHSDKEIVGWYGVRDGWGAMMMEEDQYIHKNFFMGLWQIMYLLDDKGGFRNFYIWKGDKLKQYKRSYQEDGVKPRMEHKKAAVKDAKTEKNTKVVNDSKIADDVETIDGMKVAREGKRYVKWTFAALIVALLAFVVYPKQIKPRIDKQQAASEKVENLDGDRQVPDGEQSSLSERGKRQDDAELIVLKETITGLENALEERSQELDQKDQELEQKSQELEEKEQELEQKEQELKDLKEAKEKAEAEAQANSEQDTTEAQLYRLKSGDTMSAISDKFYGNIKYGDVLGKINRVTDHKVLQVGNYVIIPPFEEVDDIYSRNATSED